MIATLKNNDGYIYGYVEWMVYDGDGRVNADGKYVYVRNIWVHEQYKNTNAFKDLVILIDQHPSTKNAEYVYWQVVKNNRKKMIDDEDGETTYLRVTPSFPKNYILEKIGAIYGKQI